MTTGRSPHWPHHALTTRRGRRLRPNVLRLEERVVPSVGSIRGTLWDDLNTDGVRDSGEPGLAGRTVYLDQNRNGVRDGDEASTTTAADGSYAFGGLATGTYNVAQVLPTGWRRTSDAHRTVKVGDFTTTVIDFNELATYSLRQLGPYRKAGFLFSTSPVGLTEFWVFPQDWKGHYAGSPALAVEYNSKTVTLRREDGAPFRLSSMAMAEVQLGVPIGEIRFIGHRSDGSTVEQAFTLDGKSGFETFSFDGFSDVTSVTWDVKSPGNEHQFDDVTVVWANPLDVTGSDLGSTESDNPPVARTDAYVVAKDTTLTANASPSFLTITSQPGEPIGLGKSYAYTPANSTMYARFNRDQCILSIWLDSPRGYAKSFESWNLSFAPRGQSFILPGSYESAEGSSILDVGGLGRGLNKPLGRFTVTQADYDSRGQILTFAATFEQRRLATEPALTGEILYNDPITRPAGVLANDSDPDPGQTLTATLVAGPGHGSLTFHADGTFSYTPDAGFVGTDHFTYRINDGKLDSEVTSVALHVGTSNEAPVARGDTYATTKSVPLVVTAPGLLANDSDGDGDQLTPYLSSGPLYGSLELGADGSFRYVPKAGFSGIDGFNYRVHDGQLDSEQAGVLITVIDLDPQGADDAYAVAKNGLLTVFAAEGVLTNDSDPNGRPLQAVKVSDPAHGTLAFQADGSFTYNPAPGYSGTDSFTYRPTDGELDGRATTVTITVTNALPIAVAETYQVGKNDLLAVTASQGVLANDTDADGDPLTAVKVSGPAHGTVILNADGSFTYSPAPGFSGTDSFSYKPSDGAAEGSPVTVTLVVAASSTSTTQFLISGPAGAVPGEPFDITVTAWDASGQTTTSYVGTVHFISTDPAASLPPDYTFAPGDGGRHTFTVTLGTVGTHSVGATDGTASGNTPVAVQRREAVVTVSVSDVDLVYGQDVKLTAMVSAPGGSSPPTGTVQFLLDGSNLGSPVPLLGGAATGPTVTALVAGTHVISANYSGDTHTSPASAPGVIVSVARAPLVVKAADASKTYGAPIPPLSLTFSGFVPGQDSAALQGTLSLTTTATQASGVGEYPITASGLSSPNYAIRYDTGAMSVTPAPLTVTAVSASRAYGEPIPPLTAAFSGFVLGQDASALGGVPTLTTTATLRSAVGTYPIIPSGLNSANYTIRYVAGTLSVTPTTLTVTAVSATRAYGEPNPPLSATFSGFVLGEHEDALGGELVLSAPARQSSGVGSYSITASGLTSSNYAIRFVPGQLSVTPARLTVAARDASRVYGDANPSLAATFSGFASGENESVLGGRLTLTTPTRQGSDAGRYPIVASGLTSSNYAIVFVPGTLTVTPAPLTIRALAASKIYGEPIPPLTASFFGLVLGQGEGVLSGTLRVTTTATELSHVGTYPIEVAGVSSPNYSIVFTSETLTVTPATLTVTADSKVRPFGESNPPLTVHYAGFVNGDSEARLTNPPKLSTAAEPKSGAGTYPIVASGASSPDYVIRYLDGSLTVNPALVSVSRVSVQTIKAGRRKQALIVVQFSEAIDQASAQSLFSYGLATIPANKRQRPRSVKLARATYDAATHAVTLTTSRPLVLNPPLQLRILGARVTDGSGRPIDGDRDGLPGGDAVAVLKVKGVTLS